MILNFLIVSEERNELVEKFSRKSMVRSEDFNIFSHLNLNMVNNCIQSSVCYKIVKTEPPDDEQISFRRELYFRDSMGKYITSRKSFRLLIFFFR